MTPFSGDLVDRAIGTAIMPGIMGSCPPRYRRSKSVAEMNVCIVSIYLDDSHMTSIHNTDHDQRKAARRVTGTPGVRDEILVLGAVGVYFPHKPHDRRMSREHGAYNGFHTIFWSITKDEYF